jgi:hypothetical protein
MQYAGGGGGGVESEFSDRFGYSLALAKPNKITYPSFINNGTQGI